MSASSSSLLHAAQFITSMDHFRRGAEDNNKDSEEQQQQQPHTHSRSSAFNPPSIIRDSSAFSKPLLPSSSSLLSPKPTGSAHFNGSSSSAFLPGSGPGPDPNPSPVRYCECLRNHAAALGGHVVDGCGEFMPAAPPSDPLKCAACGCHRSFHRREPEPEPEPGPEPGPPKAAAFRVPLLLPHHPNPLRLSGNTTDQSSSEERVHTPNTNNHHHYDYNSRHGQMGSGDEQGRKKRFRTKFSSDQKEKMRAFAERVGWRVQKKDEGEMERFCSEIGVSRQVLKVWMHNNKHLVRRQEEAMQLEGRSSESKVEDNERGLV